ncbi:MAG: 30S ribosomal protein S12 methylthiotransferase RimO [Candidatus Spyradenecus sp.]
MRVKTIGIISLGCSKNLADSEAMAGFLLKSGYQLAPSPEAADIILINTCAFIESAREEGAENILAACAHKAEGHCKAVIVAGCMPQRYRAQMLDAFPEVDAFLGVDELDRLPELVKQLEHRRKQDREALLAVAPGLPTRTFAKPIPALRLSGQIVAYTKIAEGCNHACAFCAIPQFRGHLRSRPMEAIEAEVRELIATGTREINLIAQDVTAYGKDLRNGSNLAELLRRLDALESDFWLRWLYGFHNHVTDELLEVMAGAKHIVPYFDLPIQHAHPDILRAMRRADTIAAIDTFPERLRAAVPGATLRTTCMVGFPGETEEHFQALLDYVKRVRFDALGTFIFSPEEGTAATELPGLPPPEVARDRLARLMSAQRAIAKERNRERVGTTARALLLERAADGSGRARLPHQAPEVDGLVRLAHLPEGARPGDFLLVTLTGTRGYDLTARALNP